MFCPQEEACPAAQLVFESDGEGGRTASVVKDAETSDIWEVHIDPADFVRADGGMRDRDVYKRQLETKVEEEMLARVNVLKEVSKRMAEELGREATVAELAEKMKMTEDEIRDIMKLTLDAMSVSPDAEV